MTKVHYDPNQPTSFVLVQVHDIQTYIDYRDQQEPIPFDFMNINKTSTEVITRSYHGSCIVAEICNGLIQGMYDVYPAVNNQSFILAEQYLEQSPLRTLRYNPEEMSATIYLRHLAYLATAPEIFMPSYALGYLDYRDVVRVHDACTRMKHIVERYEFAHASIEARRISRHPYLPPYVQHYGLELFKYMMEITSTQENIKRDPIGDDRENWIPLKNSYKDSLYEATYGAMISYFGGIA